MAYLVMFQGKTEQFDDNKDAMLLVQHLKGAGLEYRYTLSAGKAQPKKHTCRECGMTHYTYQQALECCK